MTWEEKSLGQCVKMLSGGTPKKSREDYWGGDIPWVSSGEMTESFLNDTSLHVTSDGAKNGTRLVPENTVLAVVRGMSLAKDFRVSITKRPMTFNQDIKAFECEGGTDPRFLFYALKARKEHIRGLATDASHGTKKLDTEPLKAVKLLFPRTAEEQRKVAEVVANYDDLIENSRRRIALLEEAGRLLYREWFVHFRFPGHKHVKIVDGIPKGWENSALEELLVLQRGFDLPVAARKDGNVPVYGSTGIVGYHDVAKVKAPMVITGRSGSLGQVTFVSIPCWPLNTTLWVKEFRRVSPWFAYFLLGELGLEKFNGGASVPTLDRKVVHRLPVVLPTTELMKAFDAQMKPPFNMIDALKNQVDQLAKARDLLLPRLMDGRLEV